MSSCFVVDTNALLRYILDDIKSQADQVEKLIKLAKAKKVELIVPQIVIFEIDFALNKYYKITKSQIVDKLQSIVSSFFLTLSEREVFKKSLVLYDKHNVSLVDCFLKAYSEEKNAQIFSFDKDFKKLQKPL